MTCQFFSVSEMTCCKTLKRAISSPKIICTLLKEFVLLTSKAQVSRKSNPCNKNLLIFKVAEIKHKNLLNSRGDVDLTDKSDEFIKSINLDIDVRST